MFKDKNFGLPQSLIDDVSKILEGSHSPSMGTSSKIGEKVAADMPAREEQRKKEMGEKVGRFAQTKLSDKLQGRAPKEKNPLAIDGVTESVKFAKFTKYLDENYHVEQLTEEEIQWIYENEFYNQLNEEERSWFGKALDYLPGYETSRKNSAAKQKQLKGMSTFDAFRTTLGDFASRAPEALGAIPAGRVAGMARALVPARTATPATSARTAASAKPTGTDVALRPGTSVKKPETGVTKNTGGQGGPIPLRSTNSPGSKNKNFDFGKFRANAQTLKTPEEIANARKATVAAGVAGAGGAGVAAALNSTKNDGSGSPSAGGPTPPKVPFGPDPTTPAAKPKTGPAAGSFRAAQETGMLTPTPSSNDTTFDAANKAFGKPKTPSSNDTTFDAANKAFGKPPTPPTPAAPPNTTPEKTRVRTTPTPTPTPRPVETQNDDWKSKVHSGGLGTAEGDTGSDYTQPSRVSRRPTSRPSRPSGGNGGDWRNAVFNPDSGA